MKTFTSTSKVYTKEIFIWTIKFVSVTIKLKEINNH